MHRHPTHGFELPEVIGRLVDWAGDTDRRVRAERALGVGSLADWLYREDSQSELRYGGHPFELVTLFWQGGDALQYRLLVHADADALVHPMVSYAPYETQLWLGDDAADGLANLMAVELRDAGVVWASGGTPEEIAEVRAEVADCVAELAEALGLRLPSTVDVLGEGARSEHPAVPRVPPGWRFEECNDEVGVLAPESAFDLELAPPEGVSIFDLDRELALASSLLARGKPASALAVARNVYSFTASDDEESALAALAMRDAYEALGRPMWARRAEAYVRAHTGR